MVLMGLGISLDFLKSHEIPSPNCIIDFYKKYLMK